MRTHPRFPDLRTLTLALLLLLTCRLAPTAAAAGVRFTLTDPAARAVFLAGEFNGWNTTAAPLRAEGGGRWGVELPLEPGRYPYKFVVDGRWTEDPAASENAEDGQGGHNSVRVVPAPGATPAPAPTPEVSPRGRWTVPGGQSFEAEFLRLTPANVAVFRLNGREYPYPLARLSAPDQARIRALAGTTGSADPAAPPSPAIAAGPVSLAGQTLQEKEGNTLEVPLGTDAAILQAVRNGYSRATPPTKARVFLAVPGGFRPTARPYPVLLVNSTGDGEATSTGAAPGYLPAATDAGFVVLAVDGPFGKPLQGQDSTAFRWALAQAGLNALAREWPGAKTWPVATAGVSGGGGYASHEAVMLAGQRVPLLGIFLSVSNYHPADFGDALRRVPFNPIHQTPIFMSAGERDTIATPALMEQARADITRTGFKNLRFERFPAGHELWTPHLQAALAWFLEQGRKSPATALGVETPR